MNYDIKNKTDFLAIGTYVNKKSVFDCYIFSCTDEEMFKRQLELISSLHPKAAHIIRVGYFANKEIASEDKEVGNSAKKILFTIKKMQKKEISIFIARKFGGTLLGVGGVEKSFMEAFKNALNNIKE